MANNVSTAIRFLRSKGLSPAQAAGIVGGLSGESGRSLSTTAKNPTSGAYGIGQWLGGRKSALFSKGNPSSLKTQLNHLWSELTGPERVALNKIRQTNSPEAATDAFVRLFERPSAGEIASSIGPRKQFAREVLGLAKSTGGGGGFSDPSAPTTRTTTKTTPAITIGAGTQQVEDPEARKRVILANLIGQRDPNSLLLKLGILDPNEPTTKTVDDPGVTVPGVTTKTTTTTGGDGSGSIVGAGKSADTSLKGTALFEGKRVAAWIKPELEYARQHGWKGQVNSGYRSFADQTRIYNSGVRPAAKPGTSNHEGTEFPRGAVDVSDAETLSRILRRKKSPLIFAGAKDPVHFSHPHGGSY